MSATQAPTSQPAQPPSGTITFTEIPVLDMARARKFYSDIFGWTFTNMNPGSSDDDAHVLLFEKNGASHGGLFKVADDCFLTAATSEKNKKVVTVTITVENVDEALKRIEKAGGETFTAKRDIGMNMGFAAHFLDTEKNVMGLWSMTG